MIYISSSLVMGLPLKAIPVAREKLAEVKRSLPSLDQAAVAPISDDPSLQQHSSANGD